MKQCRKCGIEKELNEFHKDKNFKDGVRAQCKICCLKEANKRYLKDSEKYRNKAQIYYKNNKELINEKERKRESKKKWYEKNKKRILEEHKKQREDESKKERNKRLEYHKNYFQKNKVIIYKYIKNRKENDCMFLLNSRISNGIKKALKRNKNGNHWEDLVGYTINELIEHLEEISEFTIQDLLEKDLHIDHIIPKSLYNFENYKDEEFKKCWNYRNLRIISAKENLNKRDKFDIELVLHYNLLDLVPESYIDGIIEQL